jgi:Rieske Fe-S protein
MSTPALTRRRALAGMAGAGVALPVLVACGDDGTTTTGSSGGAPTAPGTAPSSSATPGAAATTEVPAPSAAPTGFASSADVPIGGGTIFADQEVVVTQPRAGQFRCFSSICTHAGCPVTKVTTTIDCTCHGSRFSLADGSPAAGPASDPLPAVDITVTGDQISLA